MDVLYFHQYFATRRRSTATRSYELARRLVERGHRVTIVSRDTRRLEAGREEQPAGRVVAREQVDGIDVLYLNVPYANRYPTAVRMASFTAFTIAASVAGALERKPDVVFASSTPLTIGIAGLATARAKRVPFVFEIRDLWPAVPVAMGALERGGDRGAEWLERQLYEGPKRIVVLSEGSRAELSGAGFPDEKLVFIPNAADLDVFRPTSSTRAFAPATRSRIASSRSTPGRWARRTGSTSSSTPPATLRRLGRRASGDRRARRRRRAPAARGAGGRARARQPALPAAVPKEELAGIVGAADVTLTIFAPHPILETNSPNKFFDSLAAGKPVVVNLDGWLRRPRRGARGGRVGAGRERRGARGRAQRAGREP